LRLLFLDKNTVNMPPIALQSISKELDHLAQLVATHIARSRSGSNSSEDTSQLSALLQTFDSYVVKPCVNPWRKSTLTQSAKSLSAARAW
jgi:Na+/phosphate symporter